MKYPPLSTVLLLALLLFAAIPACTHSDGEVPSEDSAATAPSDLSELHQHYDALIAALCEELTALQNDTAATAEVLRARIEALENALMSLGGDPSTVTEPPTEDTAPSPPANTESAPTVSTRPPTDTLPPFPDTESAPENTTPEAASGFVYRIENGTATVLGYQGEVPARLSVPATLGGYPVGSIADQAFAGMRMESVTLPFTLTHIGWFAFEDCPNLHTVTIPASVCRIEYGAFDGCPHITLYCPTDSYAARYAHASSIPCVAV